MKNLLSYIMTAFVSVATFAQNVPPPVQYSRNAPPPGLAVDQYVFGLFLIGIIIAYKYKKSILNN